jgi:hypothetical protein
MVLCNPGTASRGAGRESSDQHLVLTTLVLHAARRLKLSPGARQKWWGFVFFSFIFIGLLQFYCTFARNLIIFRNLPTLNLCACPKTICFNFIVCSRAI